MLSGTYFLIQISEKKKEYHRRLLLEKCKNKCENIKSDNISLCENLKECYKKCHDKYKIS